MGPGNNPHLAALRAGGAAETPRTRSPHRQQWLLGGQDTRTHPGGTGPARRAGAAGLLVLILVGLGSCGPLTSGPYPVWAAAGQRRAAAGAALPFPGLHWKAPLLAGDDSICFFDRLIVASATLFLPDPVLLV